MDFGWLWYVHAGLSVVTNVPLWWKMFTMGEAMHFRSRGDGGDGLWEFFAPSTQFCYMKLSLIYNQIAKNWIKFLKILKAAREKKDIIYKEQR